MSSRALHSHPIRPALQALTNAVPPANLSNVLDALEEVLTGLNADFAEFVQVLQPVLRPTEAPSMSFPEVEVDEITAPAVHRVLIAEAQLRHLHERLFDIAERISL